MLNMISTDQLKHAEGLTHWNNSTKIFSFIHRNKLQLTFNVAIEIQ